MKERRNFICFVESCFLRNQHWVLFNFQFTKDREINVYTRRGDGVVVREEPSQLVWKNSRNNGTDRGNQEGCFSKHWDKLGRKPRIRRHTPPCRRDHTRKPQVYQEAGERQGNVGKSLYCHFCRKDWVRWDKQV